MSHGDRATDLVLRLYAHAQIVRMQAVGKLRDERGEGVISVAIAVLIMAAIGALVWVGFQTFWNTTETKTTSKLNEIG